MTLGFSTAQSGLPQTQFSGVSTPRPLAGAKTDSKTLFGASEAKPAPDAYEGDIPKCWPECIKELFRQPPQDIDLEKFRVPVGDFATPVTPLTQDGETVRAAFMKTKAGGLLKDWFFATRVGQKDDGHGNMVPDLNAPSGAVHALTLVKDKDGKEYVHFVVERRPPYGGKTPIIQLPAGVMDKPGASLLQLGMGEVIEETPFKPVKARVISSGPIPTSAGITTEQKGFIAVRAVYDKQKATEDHREGAELFISDKGMNIPLEDFVNPKKFRAWVAKQEAAGCKVGQDIFTVRGLLF